MEFGWTSDDIFAAIRGARTGLAWWLAVDGTDVIRALGPEHAVTEDGSRIYDRVTRCSWVQPSLSASYAWMVWDSAANLRRRQLTPAQRALIGAKLAALQRGDNQHSSRELPSQAAIAEKLDVSISSIKRARTIKATGATAVLEAVETGAL